MTRCDGCLLPLRVVMQNGTQTGVEPGLSLVTEDATILQFHDGDCLADWCRANNFYGRMELPIRG